MEKVIRNGKVAVLYSPGYGAGWSTWNYDNDIENVMIFHPELVKLVEENRKEEITEELIKKLANTEHYVCLLGVDGLTIEWLPKDTSFYIDEYDGFESIRTSDDLIFTT